MTSKSLSHGLGQLLSGVDFEVSKHSNGPGTDLEAAAPNVSNTPYVDRSAELSDRRSVSKRSPAVAMGYKMTHDTGFAPNPFHGVLTLATCKPKVRAHRKVGEWLAGFASAALVDRAARKGVQIPLGGLIYLAQISQVLTLDAYFDAPEFAVKRPPLESADVIALCGDNIYYRDHRGKYEQRHNRHHPPSDAPHDISGVNALVAERFYYFGRECFVPEGGWAALTGAPLSTGRTFFCPAGFAERLLKYFETRGIKEGMHAFPALLDNVPPVLVNMPAIGRHTPVKPQLPSAPRSRRTDSCGN